MHDYCWDTPVADTVLLVFVRNHVRLKQNCVEDPTNRNFISDSDYMVSVILVRSDVVMEQYGQEKENDESQNLKPEVLL